MDQYYYTKKDEVFKLGEELWNDIETYQEEYKYVIKEREMRRIMFMHQSPQMGFRKVIIAHLKKLTASKKMTHCCLHLAVYLLDIFMDNHSIAIDNISLVANVCLLLAAKMEENNGSVIKIADLNSATWNAYTVDDFKRLELLILKFFNWYIMFPTAATYTHYYIQAALTTHEVDFLKKMFQQNSEWVVLELHGKMRVYLDKIVDDIHFMQCYSPSLLGACVIAASRLVLGLQSWNTELEKFTDYKIEDIEECLTQLLKFEPSTCEVCSVN